MVSVATMLTVLTLRAGLLGDEWREMTALEWARAVPSRRYAGEGDRR